MRRFIASGIIVLALAGCSAQATTASVAAPTTVSRAAAARSTLDNAGITFLDAATDAQVDNAGTAACGVLSENGVSGASLNVLVQITEANSTLSPFEAGEVVGTFIGAYCPEYIPQVQAVINGLTNGGTY